MIAQIYVMRHERRDALEAYGEYLNDAQKAAITDSEGEFWIAINYDKKTSTISFIEDEG